MSVCKYCNIFFKYADVLVKLFCHLRLIFKQLQTIRITSFHNFKCDEMLVEILTKITGSTLKITQNLNLDS